MFDLNEILELRRPHGSKTEDEFVKDLVKRLSAEGFNPVQDAFGNVTVDNGGTTVFTCHTDTVHAAKAEGIQGLVVDTFGMMMLSDPNQGDVLGADDGAGIYVLLQLLLAGVKGRYVFFRAEEVGGLGSEVYAKEYEAELMRYSRAVAFDRKGVNEIITHQWGGRCCSDEFAIALNAQLGLDLKPSDKGTFTDTANLTHLISECTNVAVGYYDQHTPAESLDTVYLERLIQALVQVDWDKLPAKRELSPKYEDLGLESSYDDWGTYGYKTRQGNPEMEQLIDFISSGNISAEDLVYEMPDQAAELIEYLIWG
ncbi:hypothetical protein CRG49_002150 [Neisseria sp. N95_16]|uniref:Peptidase M28 domain-containing protein n=1 Tax=Neisseria brasiliensis TaxID=2666100 RepID=A0A7X2GZ01_9NEIS|nr:MULTISPECIES: hypothetical protein [Neisseria]MRN38588.1 hypothetical protein [Neisseria brasiliensis]PJO10507.1 hypothetical protein CRG49_002150 [Neisseria sp. N95_16]